jgi:uncharacterized protein YbjT (DUF2867 family)
MTILVTGATGKIGSHLVPELVKRKADVRALTRHPDKAKLPKGVSLAAGDMLDIATMRTALNGVRTLFLLNPVVPDEFTQSLIALNLAHDAGVQRIVYLSVLHCDQYLNVPHFAVKHPVERMIEAMGFDATILRPASFMQNDLATKEMIVNRGVYPSPLGGKGVARVDVRDIAETAAIELVRREQAGEAQPFEKINVVGPETLTGGDVADIWSDVLGRKIAYGGDDAAAFEENVKRLLPDWQAYSLRLMLERFQSDGLFPESGDAERMTGLLGRPLRTYRAFVNEIASSA